ncbi:MAG TPA: UDP-N-acetylmuramate--L-alanine ligase [Elusimicrobiota bacterium]|nr:UDP-N-acetylmuramate--L-alanine ligase [Elusimicrobiota bacterium]
MFKKIQRIHFVGIGGSGMSGIAEVLITLGYKVSGSDLKDTPVTRRLQKLGARIAIGHAAEHVQDAQVVVTSTAVDNRNPEVVRARQSGVPVIPRIEMLAELARLKYTIAVAGTHGKTTTTSMTAAALQAGGLDPTVIVGGRLKHVDSGAVLGKGDFLVAEADESDGSFLKLSPALAIITNIDNDHLDYYGTFERICDAFVDYAGRVPFYGCVIACLDDPHVRAQLGRMTRRVVTYGIDSDAIARAGNLRIENGGTTFDVTWDGQALGTLRLRVPGRHNVLNALAAAAAGRELDIPFAKIADGLASFEGVGRRMEIKAETDRLVVIDDYGHHPTEIRATLAALRERYPHRRLVVLFQPHRYTRTQSLWSDFANSFRNADRVHILDIYPAGEKPIDGVSSRLIVDAMQRTHPAAALLPDPVSIEPLRQTLEPGDVVVTLGAGDVWKLGEQLLAQPTGAEAAAQAKPSVS